VIDTLWFSVRPSWLLEGGIEDHVKMPMYTLVMFTVNRLTG